MLKKLPIRLRLTATSVLLLALCCVGLTAILNLSAYRMASTIEATLLTPAQTASPGASEEELPSTMGMAAVTPNGGAQVARSDFHAQSMAGMILMVVLGGALTYFLSGRALRPLQALSQQMKNRTVHNLSQALPVPESRDEIAGLTQAFNEMSRSLEEAFAMQKRFSQSAAHELRTPLTVLKTKVDVFQKKPEHTQEEYDLLLTVIASQTNRLSSLVTALLQLTNMDALDCKEPIVLDAMLRQVAQELSGLAQARHVTVSVVAGPQTIQGNAGLLHRAFYNLLENAIRYNVEGGTVTLTLSTAGEKQVVTVADTGIGIPLQAQALIFEPFYRVDKSRSRQMGGAGLGLPTVRAILEQHGGTIAVAGNAGGGTTFELTL